MKITTSKTYNSQIWMNRDLVPMKQSGWNVVSTQVYPNGKYVVNYQADVDEDKWIEQQRKIAEQNERYNLIKNIVIVCAILVIILFCCVLPFFSYQ